MKTKSKLIISAVLTLALGLFAVSTDTFATEAMTISISSDTLALNLAPNSLEGTFGKGNLNIDISLAVRGGYNLTITGSDNVGNLVGTNDNSHIISSISGTVTEENFSASANTQYNNKWGYKVEKNSVANNTFKSAPTTTTDTIDTVSNFTGTNNYVMSLGARANTATPVDSYNASFVIAAVASITCNSSATTIGNAICMQDMNDSVANSMVEGTQYQLMDNRDNKLYYIAKMKDGRVWMTQNLDLDLETTPNKVAALTHANTDLGWTTNDTSATWTPGAATVTTAAGWGTNTNTAPVSYDPGDVYYYYDKTANSSTTYNSATATADCNTAHNDGTCDHYHVGNYYNWSAAVASNDTSSITANYASANDSICPAGWRLPAGQTSSTTTDPGYYGEINYTWVNEGLATSYVRNTNSATWATDGFKNIRSNPMYMAATGYKDGTSAPASTTTYGYYWTSTTQSSTTAYGPRFYSSGPYPGYYSTTYTVRGRGMSVRCVARQANTGSTIVTFDKNASDATGTTGTNNTQTISANTLATLTTNGFTRSGYAFNSWNTEPDGSGTTYIDAARYYAKVGTETNNVTLYAIWDKIYTVTFAIGNGATSIAFGNTTDGMQTYTNGQTAQAIEGKAYTIGGNFPTKYGFNTWTTTSSGTLGDSTAASTTYTVTGDATLTLTGQEATTSITSISASGTTPDSTCKNTTPVRNVQLVYDPRDNEAYWVGELCDGNVWMLDNLRLDLSNTTTLNGLNESNTNATNTQLNYLRNGGGTTTDQWPTAGLVSSSWNDYYSVPYVKTTYKDNIAPVTYGVGSGKVGVYYNYCAASAGSYCWGNNGSYTGSPTTDPDTSSYRDIDGDICPAGWRLPSGNTNSGTTRITDYGTLYSAYASATIGQGVATRNALSTPLSGYFSGSSQVGLGTYGYFWSSTWRGTYDIYYLNSYSTGAYPVNTSSRNSGQSIRCVLGSS